MKYTVANSLWIDCCLLLFLAACFIFSAGTVTADDAIKANMEDAYPEASKDDLPETDLLIQDLQKVLHDPKAFDSSWLGKTVQRLPAPVREFVRRAWDGLDEFLQRLWDLFTSRYKHREQTEYSWTDLLRLAYIPIIFLTIGYFLFQILSRVKRDVRDGIKVKKIAEVGWQKLWREAWNRRYEDPREAIRDVIKAIIRRWVAEGRLPDDLTLTVREMEQRATGSFLSEEESKDFICLRYWYESVYFGGRQIRSEDWSQIFRHARRFLGEVPAA
jgi:hypothetical protein